MLLVAFHDSVSVVVRLRTCCHGPDRNCASPLVFRPQHWISPLNVTPHTCLTWLERPGLRLTMESQSLRLCETMMNGPFVAQDFFAGLTGSWRRTTVETGRPVEAHSAPSYCSPNSRPRRSDVMHSCCPCPPPPAEGSPISNEDATKKGGFQLENAEHNVSQDSKDIVSLRADRKVSSEKYRFVSGRAFFGEQVFRKRLSA